ncbi:hypothetical protein WS90_29830 [Burkholderia cepacia]|uniref:Uncharacterized protein n=1 Tax=Burkholderia cepacia TaxID=292 RepID=A0A118KE63_BURCE|nr:hypothetical protein WS90_29830 [Burkholderia cepacia]
MHYRMAGRANQLLSVLLCALLELCRNEVVVERVAIWIRSIYTLWQMTASLIFVHPINDLMLA